ncbi:adenosine-deaminase domain-containing protein [Cercophora newfieldiana]|uniref:Adenosine-deaminase domain-containing protein n=1 Tax=Cercophora newfieldiana TaxID=92897 RepID=A0AA40D0G4_9PEZI|nr:adenosine-deaminase domain-containing protein [Cercophora newfieldiana]
MMSEADQIAAVVHQQFGQLPAKRKPPVRDNGIHEWVPLSGIVAKGPNGLKCLSLATGMKCLPASKLSESNGVAIHDWHAEVLALRSFNHFLLQECQRLATDENASSEFLRRRTPEEFSPLSTNGDATPWQGQPFAWQPDLTLHMYCSEAPCGDASMELTMATQDDASPWTIPPSTLSPGDSATDTPTLPGRGYFSQLGIVRRKPARGDAPPSLSKSCSDKIALKQCTSLLSSLASLLVHPDGVYLSTLILPEAQFSATACERCFSPEGRMRSVAGRKWTEAGYEFVPFQVKVTAEEFEFSKRAIAARAEKSSASNLAVAWTAAGLEEGLVGGILQGRKQFVLNGASAVSRKGMWKLVGEVAQVLEEGNGEVIRQALGARTYDETKGGEPLDGRRGVKEEVRREALGGWVQNTGGGGFTMEQRKR